MAETNQPPQEKKRKPKGSINWLKLGVDKDPEFDTKYFLYDSKPTDKFYAGYLVGKNQTKEGVEYKFELEGFSESGETIETKTVTHYAHCTHPLE